MHMESIGERLEEARKRRGVSIREASETTKIRGDFLLGFENNDFNVDLPQIYVRGFVRNYANFLKIDAEKIVTDYNAMLMGEVKASRKDARELFGRMELPDRQRSVDESSSTGTASTSSMREDDSSERSGLRLPQLSPRMANYLKIGFIVLAGVLAIFFIVWMIQAIVRMATAPSTPANLPSAATEINALAALETITLIALDNVRVKVTQAEDGREIFDGPLARGESREIAKRGRVLITYDIGQNLNVEKDGRRFRMPIDGIGRSSFD